MGWFEKQEPTWDCNGSNQSPRCFDSALFRPGRFDRRVVVDKPSLEGFQETLRFTAKNQNVSFFKQIASKPRVLLGADLKT